MNHCFKRSFKNAQSRLLVLAAV